MGFIIQLANQFGPVSVIAGFFLAAWAIRIAKKTIKLALLIGAIAVLLISLGLL